MSAEAWKLDIATILAWSAAGSLGVLKLKLKLPELHAKYAIEYHSRNSIIGTHCHLYVSL